MKKYILVAALVLASASALAATWVEVAGRFPAECKKIAEEKYGDKLVGEGSCRADKDDNTVYCRFLINDN